MAAELMHGSASSLGCPSYLEAQKKACQCRKDAMQYYEDDVKIRDKDAMQYYEDDVKIRDKDAMQYYEEEVKKRDILDVLGDLDHVLDLDTKDEL
jgi:hypothetical protein